LTSQVIVPLALKIAPSSQALGVSSKFPANVLGL
jgi:hypothetical protein